MGPTQDRGLQAEECDQPKSAGPEPSEETGAKQDYDMDTYDEALGMVKEAEDIFTALGDKEGL
eukprot:7128866-Alexandrium_andersonii.AAC.1